MNNPSSNPLRILVADRGETAPHPELATLKRLGHRLDVVETIDEAAAAMDREAYDIVLMNFGQARAASEDVARLQSRPAGSARIPRIVSVGAPLPDSPATFPSVSWNSLVEQLPELLEQSAVAPAQFVYLHVDPCKAVEAADGDHELVSSLVELYFEQLPSLVSGIRSGIDDRLSEQVERNAHSLKGAISIFGAVGLRQAAYEMEHLGRESRWNEAEEKWLAIERELAVVEPEMRALGRETAAGRKFN
ncbi:MAG TPA: hypothetical protein DCY13_17505 [Verrucomicrobiales bacterium]|nr:hypothetical protein [Verrucomicrobiales bacterium]